MFFQLLACMAMALQALCREGGPPLHRLFARVPHKVIKALIPLEVARTLVVSRDRLF